MRRKGVCYEAGRELEGRSWRPDFRPGEVRRELEIIAGDLHCTAVKIHSADLPRLGWTAQVALELGLEAWLSPDLWDHDAEDTLAHVMSAARLAEELRHAYPGRVVLSVGGELCLFMQGIIPGDAVPERIARPDLDVLLRAEATQESLDEFLARTAAAVRAEFGGQITYCALPTEQVDWTRFDVAAVDLYRDRLTRPRFGRAVQVLKKKAKGRPLIIGEFGCCTYQGAADRGGSGFDIIDHGGDQPHVNGYMRDEAGQAQEITECLDIFNAGGADIAFVQTFVQPLNPWSPDPRFDFDLASYSLVKSFASRLGDLAEEFPKVPFDSTKHGSTYPDMPWEPKASFHAVAAWNAAH
ncbi:hypothetical protein GCM10023322_71180 [Rugosimonospora acidiphila]|uniref:Abortive infection protein n=1 Tax=Rugosimonospora acidiphila TaxID=556531 RepID=A0ABP9SM09_9ACTN